MQPAGGFWGQQGTAGHHTTTASNFGCLKTIHKPSFAIMVGDDDTILMLPVSVSVCVLQVNMGAAAAAVFAAASLMVAPISVAADAATIKVRLCRLLIQQELVDSAWPARACSMTLKEVLLLTVRFTPQLHGVLATVSCPPRQLGSTN
jgi:hypothetical protein